MMTTDILRAEARHLFQRNHVLQSQTREESSDSTATIKEQFLALETFLNSVKSQLNDKPPVDWKRHTSLCNLAANVNYKIRHHLGHHLPLLTQAFLKFFEIVSVYGNYLVPSSGLCSFHLCEAPGAFVTALEQYLLQRFGTSSNWTWRASTLSPYFEGNSTEEAFVDDRLIFDTLDNWVFGPSGTGNIFSLKIPEKFEHTFDLVTADGSVDCQNYPAAQEQKVLPLFYAETRCALRLLKNQGCLVIKMFTFFRHETRQLLALFKQLFKTVIVTKPSCSRSGNSEVYIVCIGYNLKKGVTLIDTLDTLVTSDGRLHGDLIGAVDDNFEREVLECSEKFTRWQTSAIQENIERYECMSRRQREKLDTSKKMVAAMYLSSLPVKKLAPHVEARRQLRCTELRKPSLSKGRAWNVVPFEERSEPSWWRAHACALFSRLQELHPSVFRIPTQEEMVYEKSKLIDLYSIRISTGECSPIVTVSKFIEQSLLDLYYMMFPERSTSPEEPVPAQVKEDAGTINITMQADFSSNESRIRFLTEVEKQLGAVSTRDNVALLLTVAFSETISRFSAGLVFLLSQVFDEVEFAVTRVDHICFTFSLDDTQQLDIVVQAVARVKQALESCPEGITVTEIFPLRKICLSGFYRFLYLCNERYYAAGKAAVELMKLVGQQKASEALRYVETEVG